MKTTNRLLISLALFIFSSIAYSQERHVISLHVNTTEINNQNVNQQCFFMVVSPGKEPVRSGEDIENFTLEVSVGDTLIWNGISTTAPESDTVEIRKIKHEKGTNVFDKNELDGSKTILAKVMRETAGKNYKYKISFKVSTKNNVFHIDPVIIVKP